MRTARAMLVGILVLGFTACRQATRTGPPAAAAQGGAAAAYDDAFAIVRRIERSPDRQYLSADAPLDEAAERFLARNERLFELLYRAADAERAPLFDVGTVRMEQALADLSLARQLGGVAVLRARHHFEQDRPREGVDDLLASIALGRHVGQTPLLVTSMMHLGLEAQGIDQLSRQLPRLPPDVLADLRQQLAALPEAATFEELIRGEQAYGRRELVRQGLPNPDEIADAMSPLYDAAAAHAGDPPDEFARALDASLARIPTTQPAARQLAGLLPRSLVAFRESMARVDAEREALHASLAAGGSANELADEP